GKNHYVQQRGDADEQQSVLNHRSLQVDLRIDTGQLAGVAQLSPTQENTHRDQHQSQNKNPGKDQENQQADVWMRWAGQHEVVNPECDHSDRAAGGKRDPDKADGVLDEVVQQTCPVFDGVLWIHAEMPQASLVWF